MAFRMDVSEPSERTGRLLMDNAEESGKAFNILCEAGFSVNVVPVSGTIGPELTMGSKTYYGLSAIKSFIQVNNGNNE